MEHLTFFTSDTHYFHGNVIRYCDRPWAVMYRGSGIYLKPSQILNRPIKDIPYEELKAKIEIDLAAMNRALVSNWNDVVAPFDTVYHLGDFSFGSRQDASDTLRKLNGKKILIRGNHDRSPSAMREIGFDEVYESLEAEIDGVRLYMHHQPQVRKYWGRAQIHLCGHVHEKWTRYGDMINVGVDRWNFAPRTVRELMGADSQGHWPKAEEME